jgi:hypothetical protein
VHAATAIQYQPGYSCTVAAARNLTVCALRMCGRNWGLGAHIGTALTTLRRVRVGRIGVRPMKPARLLQCMHEALRAGELVGFGWRLGVCWQMHGVAYMPPCLRHMFFARVQAAITAS